MSIEETLFSTLDNDATLTALVASRIYPSVAPDNAAVPYVTYQLIATESHNVINGAAGSERKLFQVNCYAKKTATQSGYDIAKAMATACKLAINGTVGYTTGEGDDYFSKTQNHRVRVDFSLIG